MCPETQGVGVMGRPADRGWIVDKKGERRNCSLEKGICLWSI